MNDISKREIAVSAVPKLRLKHRPELSTGAFADRLSQFEFGRPDVSVLEKTTEDHPRDIKSYYETYWSTGHETFSGDNQGYAKNFRTWMYSELEGIRSDTEILEVGCGDGSFTQCLAGYGARITAIDISAGQIAQNASRFPHINFQQHDVANPLPFAANRFGVIWCSEVLEHLIDPEFALREMHRVMAPGGKLLVTVPFHGRLKNLLIALFNFDEHYTPSNPHIRFYTKNTLTRIARESGFVDVFVKTCGINRPLRDLIISTNLLLTARKTAAGTPRGPFPQSR